MFINNLGFQKNKRKGRGEASKGKTSGRGNKGQKSRSGSKKFFNFENNSFKFLKKFHKFGFKKKKYINQVSLFKINKLPISIISKYSLFKLNILKIKNCNIKIFSNCIYLKNMIFYNIKLSKLIILFNFKFHLIYNDQINL